MNLVFQDSMYCSPDFADKWGGSLMRSEFFHQFPGSFNRRSPEIIKGSRRRRIAEGSGTSVQMVNQVLAQYEQMKGMMKSFGKMTKLGSKNFKLPGMMKNLFKG